MRKLVGNLLCLICVLGLFACSSGGGGGDSSTGTTNTSENISGGDFVVNGTLRTADSIGRRLSDRQY